METTEALSKTNYGFARSPYFHFCFFFSGGVISRRGILMVAEKHEYVGIEVFSVNSGIFEFSQIRVNSAMWHLLLF